MLSCSMIYSIARGYVVVVYASHYHPGFRVWSSVHMTVSPALFYHFKCELLVVYTFGPVIPAMHFGPAMVVCSPR